MQQVSSERLDAASSCPSLAVLNRFHCEAMLNNKRNCFINPDDWWNLILNK